MKLDVDRDYACTTKTLEAPHRSDAALDGTMMLLDDTVQVLLLADSDPFRAVGFSKYHRAST